MLSVGIIALNLERNDIMNIMSLAYGALVTDIRVQFFHV